MNKKSGNRHRQNSLYKSAGNTYSPILNPSCCEVWDYIFARLSVKKFLKAQDKTSLFTLNISGSDIFLWINSINVISFHPKRIDFALLWNRALSAVIAQFFACGVTVAIVAQTVGFEWCFTNDLKHAIVYLVCFKVIATYYFCA